MLWQHQSHSYGLEGFKSPIKQVTYSSGVDGWLSMCAGRGGEIDGMRMKKKKKEERQHEDGLMLATYDMTYSLQLLAQ